MLKSFKLLKSREFRDFGDLGLQPQPGVVEPTGRVTEVREFRFT
jgi:hypothetical protein